MASYRNFAIAGANGLLGKFFVDALLKAKASGSVGKAVILTRSEKGSDGLIARGAEPIVVNYDTPSTLQSALQGIDVVLSTFHGPPQEILADSAKAAGVKLFVPSEYAGDTTLHKEEKLFAPKDAFRRRLEQIGLPWAAFFTGPFADWIFYQPILGFDLPNGKAEVAGTGEEVLSYTSRADVARYVVHVTSTLAPSKLHNRAFKVSGERTSVTRLLAEYEQRTGTRVALTRVPVQEAQARADAGDVKAQLELVLRLYGAYGGDKEMNVDWPEFGPDKVVDSILSYKRE
ncbi:NAD(P)-binding protein [Calocera cornea HHB12733]|uniref:NAD(P)-binding protein n=1 Tax=Calocera cornea HHB12733 TaxID=1353952 RepID=A0A165F037_9BASI|nr:NAD(P)-binding protein [Calocera cornea HHB12733]